MIGISLLALSFVSPSNPPQRDHLEDSLTAAIQRGYEDLRVHPSIRMTMTYSSGTLQHQTRAQIVAFWFQPTLTDPAKFEMVESDLTNGAAKPALRIVANNGEIGVYHPADNTYSVSRYGVRTDSFRGITGYLCNSDDPAIAPIAKLLDQVFGSSYPVFSPWLPGAYPDGSETHIIFGRGGGQLAASQVEFALFPLKWVSGLEKSADQINPTITRWNLILEHIPIGPGVSGADFSFSPPPSAKRVSN